MKVYEIEFEIYGNSEWNYIVAKSTKEVLEWLKENSKYEIEKIECLGNCVKIIGEKENE